MNRTDPIMCKRDFIEEWYNRGYNTPSGGWELYDIHHIKPRQYGGSNSFDNLTPVQKNTHDTLDTWWKSFGGKNDK